MLSAKRVCVYVVGPRKRHICQRLKISINDLVRVSGPKLGIPLLEIYTYQEKIVIQPPKNNQWNIPSKCPRCFHTAGLS